MEPLWEKEADRKASSLGFRYLESWVPSRANMYPLSSTSNPSISTRFFGEGSLRVYNRRFCRHKDRKL
jgi:hypothetical protein